MKKFLILFTLFILFGSCKKKEDEVDILVTIYPFKLIIDELSQQQLNIDVLLPQSVDPHTYELVPSDLIKAQQSELFIYCDKNLDGWAAKLEAKNKIQLSDYLPDSLKLTITDPILENHNHSHNHNHTHFDPHFWTDPVTVKAMIDNIVNLLIKHFPEKRIEFIENAEKFKDKLDELNSLVYQKTKLIENKNIFSSHPFYNYFFKRYEFKIVGFLEVSPGQVLSPKEMKEIMDLVKENNVKAIFTNKQHSDRTTKILAESLGIKYYDLDPMGGTDELYDYASIVNHNLKIIEHALK